MSDRMAATNAVTHALTNGAAADAALAREAAQAEDIRGLKDPVPLGFDWGVLWWLALPIAAAVIAYLVWRQRKRRKPQSVSLAAPPPVPAHRRALERLREALGLIDRPRPFVTAVSDAVRFYLEDRFQLRAPERATEEFLDEMKDSDHLSDDHKRTLEAFLTEADLVKFARHEPSRDSLGQLHATAVRFVEETSAEPPPSAASIAEPAAPAAVEEPPRPS